jgi:hypothetical protein
MSDLKETNQRASASQNPREAIGRIWYARQLRVANKLIDHLVTQRDELQRQYDICEGMLASALKYRDEVATQRDELLAALKMAVLALEDNNIDESMSGEFEILTDAIASAERGKQ